MKPELSFLAVPLVAGLPSSPPHSERRKADASIHEAFANAGKSFFGTATDQGLPQTDPNAAIIQANFGQVTGENSMKWGSLAPNQGEYNWAGADFLADWATDNNKLPAWVEAITDAEQLREAIRNHVSTTVGRYAGRIAHWDVVNEIFAEDGSLRDSVFSQLLGEEFVQIAFRAAREADPDALLYINDYNLDQANYGKVKGMVSFVQKWVDAGVPIDGIGTQTHISEGMGAGIQGALEELASAPVGEIAITELDIANAPAEDYTAVVQACLNVEKCTSITVWGVSDADSWRQGENPLLFDGSFSPKDAYGAIINLLGS